RHAHAARAKSDGETEAQRQGLKHGRQFSLANVRTRAADRIGLLAPPLLGQFTASYQRRVFPYTRGLKAYPSRRRHPSAPESSPWAKPWRAIRSIVIPGAPLEYVDRFAPTGYGESE